MSATEVKSVCVDTLVDTKRAAASISFHCIPLVYSAIEWKCNTHDGLEIDFLSKLFPHQAHTRTTSSLIHHGNTLNTNCPAERSMLTGAQGSSTSIPAERKITDELDPLEYNNEAGDESSNEVCTEFKHRTLWLRLTMDTRTKSYARRSPSSRLSAMSSKPSTRRLIKKRLNCNPESPALRK